jgi:hypothetical protein
MTADQPFDASQPLSLENALLLPRIVIESTAPVIEGGQFAVKSVVGQILTIATKVYADGHDKLAVRVRWRAAAAAEWHTVPMRELGNDSWQAELAFDSVGRHLFCIEAWIDQFASYRYELEKKFAAGVSIGLELEEGRLYVQASAERSEEALKGQLLQIHQQLGELEADAQVALLLAADTAQLMALADHRAFLTSSPEYPLEVERSLAQFASWYELFPRSITDDKARHGTFKDVHNRLAMVRDMGFDVLYFPPIHPIGRAHRKGPNNSLTSAALMRSAARTVATRPSTLNWAAAKTSASWSPPLPSTAWRSPSTSLSSVPRTIRGSNSIRAGSPGVRTGPSVTRKTHRRNTRTSSTSISTPPTRFRASGPSCAM